MLIPQEASRQADRRQGRRPSSLTELRGELSDPSKLSDGHRQCLLDLKRRLALVQLLGDEFARVEFSPFVAAAAERYAGAV